MHVTRFSSTPVVPWHGAHRELFAYLGPEPYVQSARGRSTD